MCRRTREQCGCRRAVRSKSLSLLPSATRNALRGPCSTDHKSSNAHPRRPDTIAITRTCYDGCPSLILVDVVSTVRVHVLQLRCSRMKPGVAASPSATVRASSRLTSKCKAKQASQYEWGRLSSRSLRRMSDVRVRLWDGAITPPRCGRAPRKSRRRERTRVDYSSAIRRRIYGRGGQDT